METQMKSKYFIMNTLIPHYVLVFLHSKSLSHLFICSWHIMQRVPFHVSFNYAACKRYLFAHHENECFSLAPSTSGSSTNTTYIFAWVAREVKQHHMIHTCKVNPPGCSVEKFRRISKFKLSCLLILKI